jgi:hypothetical protein
MGDTAARVPRARKEGLVVEELPDELMICDTATQQVSCLNRTAAFVWRHCDGRRTVGALARHMAEEFGAPVDETAVWYSLRLLGQRGLLEGRAEVPAPARRMTRRQAVRALGLAAAAVPLVTTMIVPPAAHAQSGTAPECIPIGSPCDLIEGPPCCGGATCTFDSDTETFRCAPANP